MYSKKRKRHKKNRSKEYQMCLKNKRFKLPGVQKLEEELMGLGRLIVSEPGLGWQGEIVRNVTHLLEICWHAVSSPALPCSSPSSALSSRSGASSLLSEAWWCLGSGRKVRAGVIWSKR